ncbi:MULTISPECIES: helix-turn-helix domain-containing protein [unclassified Rhodococcus (in: high G+C Gram-positive bacteria)]|uniref:IclR family transcriptional regulator n=1 Tax=Rhodococcus TaxID=1827 RepID=UPI0006862EDE|nr:MULTISPECIES: helix-turn-helix domain-containing protein [unclassified Rhodococcus (in: high G+C Gram-positive bacteria)]
MHIDDPQTVPKGTIQRTALILSALENAERLTLSRIVAATGLSRTSVHRALEQLVELRWVHRDGMDYQLGLRMIELGSAAAQHNMVRRAALPTLHRLHRISGCVVHLGVLDGDDAVYLEAIGDEGSAVSNSRAGKRLPAASSTIGRALLAALGSDSPEAERVRQTRLAYDQEQCRKGFGCAAVPIGRIDTGQAAALSVFGPSARIGDRRLLASAQSAAAEIWRRIQASPPTGRVARTWQHGNGAAVRS